MANPTQPAKRKQPPSDFKHRRAKVGKRAIKPANVTETSFKTATVNVGRQNISGVAATNEASSGELYSTRGRSITDLTAPLRHPAPTVRISAAKGLKDAVTRTQTTPEMIRSNLAILIPACAKCCVDECQEVRQLALAVLRGAFLKVLSDNDITLDSYSVQGANCLRPFVPLLMAHVTSTLNSLDAATQMDGADVVGMLSSTIPTLVSQYCTSILPTFGRILSNRSSQSQTGPLLITPTSASEKKKKRKDTSEIYPILHSLLALLQTVKSTRRSLNPNYLETTMVFHPPDLVIADGGRTVNGLFLQLLEPPNNNIPQPIYNVQGLSNYFGTINVANGSVKQATPDKEDSLGRETVCDLLGKLRDALAEIVQKKDLNKQDVQELFVLVQSLHLFWNQFCYQDLPVEQSSKNDSLRRLWSQVVGFLMDIFPVTTTTVNDTTAHAVNIEMCTAILDSCAEGMTLNKDRTSDIISYLFLQLEHCRPIGDIAYSSSVVSGDALFGAIGILLRLSYDPETSELLEKDTYQRVVQGLALNYFPDASDKSNNDFYRALARSSVGRKCAHLAYDILAQNSWTIAKDDSNLTAALTRILQGLVGYLKAWDGDYVAESCRIVTVLHNVVCRLNVDSVELSSEETNWLAFLRACLGPLLKCKTQLTRKKAEVSRTSIFESYPEELQRKVMGLVVMLQAPSQSVLDGLSDICARAHGQRGNPIVSPEMAGFIVQAVHNIRKTVSIQAFLGFVTSSTGLMSLSKSTKSGGVGSDDLDVSGEALWYDQGIEVACRSLILCNWTKVLPLIQPLVKDCLVTKFDESSPSLLAFCRVRAAITILARCTGYGVSVFDLLAELQRPTTEAVISMLQHIPANHDDGHATILEPNFLAYVDPVVCLFEHEAKLVQEFCLVLASRFDSLPGNAQLKLMPGLIEVTNDVRLSHVMKIAGRELMTTAKSIEIASKGGPAERLGGRLRALVEVHCGSNHILVHQATDTDTGTL